MGLTYSFRDLVYYLYGSMQADLVLQEGLRVLHLDLQAAEATLCPMGHSLSTGDLKAYPHSDNFLQQGYLYSSKVIRPDRGHHLPLSQNSSLWLPTG